MQSISGYLYEQTLNLVINLDSAPNRENQLVYAKPLQLFKGIDNKIKLLFKNQDQKLQSLLDSTIIFNLMDSATRELIFSRRVTPWINKGVAYITIDSVDLNDLTVGGFNYSVLMITGEGETKIVYADDNYNAQGQARLSDGVYPIFQESLKPNLGPFYNNTENSRYGYSIGNVVYSDILTVIDRVKSRAVSQTVQYYLTNFSGIIEVQGSLSATLSEMPSDWFTIQQSTLSEETGNIYSNFQGKFGLVRFKITTDNGSVDKILYRP
jgi:hypothetical protein